MGKSKGLRSALLASCAVLGAAAASPAMAGGFAVREQSAEFQGMSFAGDAAAGGGLSGMFWNPAVAAYAPKGYSSESDAAGIFGHVTETAQAGSTFYNAPGLSRESGNVAKPALVPSSYMAYRLTPDAVLALSFNAPFGLTTEPSNNAWTGQTQARFSEIKTYDAVPTLALRLSPQLSVGVGVQIDYIKATLRSAGGLTVAQVSSPNAPDGSVEGQDTSVGFTAGANWTPSAQTSIGVGYRSAISHKLKGTFAIQGLTADSPIEAEAKLPSIATLSVRQGINDKLRVMGTVEWTQWSSLQSLNVVCTGAGQNCPFGAGSTPIPDPSLALNWHDSWMFALGGEYDYSRQLKLRTGIAYEISPIQNPGERTAKLPDQNRFTLSGGAGYALSDMIGLEMAYSHLWGLGGGIDRTQGPIRLVADVSSSVDIISGAVKFKLNP